MSGNEALHAAVRDLGRRGFFVGGCAAVVAGGRRSRTLEVRPDRAGSQHGDAATQRTGDERALRAPHAHHRPHRASPWRCSAQCSMTWYIEGMTNRVSNVAMASPPTTTVAMPRCTSLPTPV